MEVMYLDAKYESILGITDRYHSSEPGSHSTPCIVVLYSPLKHAVALIKS